ncbi:MAG: flagellar basal body protein [Armatimonadota bacterium]|nr:flagellar basal body protein [Armatimonadota bacterium]
MRRWKAVISGFYTSAAGMLGQIEQQDVISNNLANCNSAGLLYRETLFPIL